MSFTLQYGGVTQTFADWGLKGLKRSQVSQAVGGVSFIQSGASYKGTPLFDIDAVVTISKDGVPWHVGPVIQVPREGAARSESLSYQVADPWWYLEQLPFEQTIRTGSAGVATQTTNAAVFWLVSGGSGSKQNVQGVIASAVAHAVDAGAAMQVAFSGAFGASPPVQEMRNATCAEVIRAALKYVPDATSGWDYSTTPPTLRFATRAAATARSIDLADRRSVNLISITPRDDLRRDRVVINYEITSVDDNETYVDYASDAAGTGSPFRTLKATIPLSGPNTQRQTQWLKTQATSSSSAAWWKRRVPTLKTATELTIEDATEEPAEEDGDSFSFEIVEGQIPGWYDEEAVSGSMRISAKATYKVTGEDDAVVEYEKDPISVVLRCTNLGTNLYSRVSSYTEGEPVPSGLAAAFLAAFSVVQYDGKIRIKKRECSFICRTGEVLNLLNGAEEWETARMQVQQVAEDVDAGETVITFGPAKHLSPQDVVEMLRSLRGRPVTHTLMERATGRKNDGNEAKGGRDNPGENGNVAASQWTKVVCVKGDRKLTLSAEDGVKLEEGGDFISHDTANMRTLHQDAEGNTAELKATQFEIMDSAGNGITITADSLVISSDGKTTTLSLNSLAMADGGKTANLTENGLTVSDGANVTTLEANHILLDGGTGKTNSLTDEQIILSAGGITTTLEAASVSLQNGADTADLDTTQMSILKAGDTVTVSPEGGLDATADGNSAQISPAGGVSLVAAGGGTVDIQPVTGETVLLRETDVCDGGVDSTTYVLRGL
jgi:hypothetical protein